MIKLFFLILLHTFISSNSLTYKPYAGIISPKQRLFQVSKDSNSPVSFHKVELSNKLKSLSKIMFAALAIPGSSTSAKVFIDTDLYGDKELKIATVNKLKQKLRDAIIKDISLAPQFLEIAINDALGYNSITQDGGPDGSIQFELDLVGNKSFENAIQALQEVKKSLQRTNSVSFADVVAFAGAEALESAGCDRITVQIGREDAKKSNKNGEAIDWSSELSSSGIVDSFKKSGLSEQEVALLFGALGELRRVVQETLDSQKLNPSDDEDDSPLDPSFEELVPSTFGSRDKTYGAKIGQANFGVNYLLSVTKSSGKTNTVSNDNLKPVLLGDPIIKESFKKYASNKLAFITDLKNAYLKLTLLGEAYSTRNS